MADHAHPALSGSSAGAVFRSTFPDYNASAIGNFPSSVFGWQVGTPAYVPSTGLLWLPNRGIAANGLAAPKWAPAILDNTTTNVTIGVENSVENTSAFLYDPVDHLLYSADYNNGTVGVLNPTTGGWLKAIAVGTEPTALVLDPTSDLLFVANYGSNNVTVINGSTNSVEVPNIATGPAPHALAFDPVDDAVFVADAGDSWVWKISVTKDTASEFAPVSGYPEGLSYSSTGGSLAVTSSLGNKMTLLQGSIPVTIALTNVGAGAGPVEVNANSSEFVVGITNGSSLVTVNSSTGAIVDSHISVGTNVTSLGLDTASDTAFAWAAVSRNVSAVNLGSDRVKDSLPTLGPEPGSSAYDPDGNRMFMVNAFGGSVLDLNATTGATVAAPLTFDSPAMSLAVDPSTSTLYVGLQTGVYAIDPLTGLTVATDLGLTGGNSPLLVDPSDGFLWDANGAEGLVALQLPSLSLHFTVGIKTGLEIQQQTMALLPASHELFVLNATTKEVQVVDTLTGSIVGGPIAAGSGASAIAYDPIDDLVYVVGVNVTVIDPLTYALVGAPIPLVAHSIATGIAFDPTRSYLYVTTAAGLPSSVGTVSVIDGTNLSASYGPQVTFPVGELPTDPNPVLFNGSSSPEFSVIWVANFESGTLSVVASPPEITFFSASPNPIDLGQTTELLLGYEGGSGPDSISYQGLPSGCATEDEATLNCTPTVSGNFSLTANVVDVFGSSASASVNLTVARGLAVRVSFSPDSIPAIDVNTTLSATAGALGGTAPYSYAWTFGDGSTGAGPTVSHAYGTPGQYLLNVTVTDSARAERTSSTIVEVNPTLSAYVTVEPGRATDVNLPLTLVATVSGGTFPSAGNFSFGDGDYGSGDEVSHTWTQPGNYNVTFEIADADGESVTRVIPVEILPALTATCSSEVPGSTSPPTPGTNVSFTATIAGGLPPYNISWSFGDGSWAYGATASHAYGRAGNYTVHVTVVDAAGLRVTAVLPEQVVASSSSSSSGPNLTFDLGTFFGVVVGGAVAALVFFAASTARRRKPPPPSPYVPPTGSPLREWKGR